MKLNRSLKILFFILISNNSIKASSWWDTITAYPKATFATLSAATIAGLYWLTKPNKTLPTFEQLNVVSFIPIKRAEEGKPNTSKDAALKILKQKKINNIMIINGMIYRVENGINEGIKNLKKPVTIYSGGYSNDGRPYSYCGFTAIKAGLMPGACITFDFATDTRRGFNFCQTQDIHCVKTVCKEVIARDPQASIVLHGACKGAANNLRFLAELSEAGDKEHYLRNIKGVIAESPPISVRKALQHTPLSAVTLTLMRGVFPNYDPNAKNIMHARRFPAIPTLVASLPKDTISDLDDVRAMQTHLNANCKGSVELYVSRTAHIRHGQIGKDPKYQAEVAQFYTTHQLRSNA